jgi:hypothetical protein
MSSKDDVWDCAYTQSLLLWLSEHGYTPNTIPAANRKLVIGLAREHAMYMADLTIEAWLISKAPDTHQGGSMIHLLFDRDSTYVLDSLKSFTQLSAGEVIRNAIATYEWLRQRLDADEAVTITREMCPHLAPKPRSHLKLV